MQATAEQCLALHSPDRPLFDGTCVTGRNRDQECLVAGCAARGVQPGGMTVVMDRRLLKDDMRLFTT